VIQLQTKAEQRLEWLEALDRPLTDEESDELRRAMHAVYQAARRANHLAQHREEELKLLRKMRVEAKMRSDLA
jgi:predicted DNA-binding protein YlxM (UPF0122 family)